MGVCRVVAATAKAAAQPWSATLVGHQLKLLKGRGSSVHTAMWLSVFILRECHID
jgi:hypothetical protein